VMMLVYFSFELVNFSRVIAFDLLKNTCHGHFSVNS